MRKLQPVLWSKGTLLTPQHLQAQDRFLEDSLQFWLESLVFCPWGFCELRVDREALAGGLFSISSASGIFPDGLLFEIPDADNAPPSKSLLEHFGPTDFAMDIYLAIPLYRERGINVSAVGSTTDARFVADVTFARDEVRGAVEKPIQIARKGFRLLMESESRQGHSSLRVARIQRTAAGVFHLDEHFVPPVLDISASDGLMTMARRLLEILNAKSAELAMLRRQRNQSLADFASSESFWLLYAVNTHYPIFRHLFEVRRGHPEQLYAAMTSLAGVLTTFSLDIHPRDLPLYDHNDLSACFAMLDEKVRLLLGTVMRKNYVALPMQQVQPSIYATAVADDRFYEKTHFYLAVRADIDHAELIAKGPVGIKVGSANHIDQFVRRALTALELTHVARPPAALPAKPNFEYFRLTQTGDVWESIIRSRNLAAWVPAEFRAAEIELIILLSKPL